MTITFAATSNDVKTTKSTDKGIPLWDAIRTSKSFVHVFDTEEDSGFDYEDSGFENQDSKGIIIQASDQKENQVTMHLAAKGFVSAVTTAYNKHHDLVLRPDDVWQAILTQFSFYVQAHAEELRDRLVDFQGKKTLVVKTLGSLFTVDHGDLARKMVDQISVNLKDPSVTEWLLPQFSTTTVNDQVVASVSVMATLQAYFEYVFELACGIPKVTLLGTVDDWRCLRRKLDRLWEFDLEERRMQSWHALLAPVLDGMVRSAEGSPSLEFWDTICSHHGGGSGPRYLSGWITVFACFTKDGEWQGDIPKGPIDAFDGIPAKGEAKWPWINTNKLPVGVVSVPVLVDDNGTQYDTHMLAGQFAYGMNDEQSAVIPRNDWCIAYEGKVKQDPRDYKHGEVRPAA